MDIWKLKKGNKIVLESGSIAEVLSPTQDGEWINIKYLTCTDNPKIVGTEDLCHEDEISSLAPKSGVKSPTK